jgi:hypothetical protein
MNIETLRKLDIGGILNAILVRQIPVRDFTWNDGPALLVDGCYVIYPVGVTLGVARRFDIPTPEGEGDWDFDDLGVFDAPVAIAKVAAEIAQDDVRESLDLETMYRNLSEAN